MNMEVSFHLGKVWNFEATTLSEAAWQDFEIGHCPSEAKSPGQKSLRELDKCQPAARLWGLRIPPWQKCIRETMHIHFMQNFPCQAMQSIPSVGRPCVDSFIFQCVDMVNLTNTTFT